MTATLGDELSGDAGKIAGLLADFHRTRQSKGRRASSVRELMPSLVNTLRRWKSTVRVLRNSCAATSRVCSPRATKRATWISCGVSFRTVDGSRLRAVRPAARSSSRARFERWRDLPAEGWWSGDAHIHIARGDGGDQAALTIARAEDLHVANLLAMGNIGAQYFAQPHYGPRGRASRDDYNLVSGQEDPRTGRRGHTIHLNIAERARDVERYFLYHELFARLRAGGSVSGYAHVGSDWFGDAAGLALDVPFGIVDVVEVLQAYRLRIHPWYDFLNLGFRLTPIAGSDYPYIDPAGAVRFFAQIEGSLTPDAWFDAIRAGRTFVSNGPMLSFHVGAATMGEAVQIEPGESLQLHAQADVNPDLDEVERLELVAHGKVVAATNSPGRVEVQHRLSPAAGCWVAARAVGSNRSVAHSAPVYVMVGGAEHTWHAPSVPAIVDRMEALLRDLIESTPDQLVEGFERWDVEASYYSRWLEVLPDLKIRVDEAIDRYERIRAMASTGGQ
jgi:hypothetical protein